jgi:two-component system, chemotaxis family, protein-glutamate methylesterase/glutaminase
MAAIKSVVVVGASAGGLKAITELMAGIPLHSDVAICVVLHLGKNSSGHILVSHLQKVTAYKCSTPDDGDTLRGGHLYIARPDHHMMIRDGIIRLNRGPHENMWRPSIDVLFRSAAVTYDGRTIGIILTGLLDDGTAGMHAIKRCRGICIVQEPLEAEFADMPANVLNKVDVDYRVSIGDIGYILEDIHSKPPAKKGEIPEEIRLESEITENMVSKIEELEKIGTHSNYTCPDCGGGLWAVKNDPVYRYRCFTGHVYTERLLLDKQSELLEESIWVSIRIMEEREDLLNVAALHQKELGNTGIEKEKLRQAKEVKEHIARLKKFAAAISNGDSDTKLNGEPPAGAQQIKNPAVQT